MERLTLKTPTGAVLALNNPRTEQEAKEQLTPAYKVVDKLSAYEDTFLEPSEIEELIVKLNKCKELLRKALQGFKYIDTEFGCAGCHKNWKNCPFNKGKKDVCAEHWVHADEVEEVLKDE